MTRLSPRALLGGLVLLAILTAAAAVATSLPADEMAVTVAAADTAPPLPFGAPTSYLIGLLLLEQRDPAAALPYLEYAYRLAPDEREIAAAFVSALIVLGRRDTALQVLADRVRAAPDDREARRQLIALLTDERRFEEALATLAAGRLAGDDDPELLLLEGEILARSGRRDEAVTVYREALERLPEDVEQISVVLATLLRDTGRAEELPAFWRHALAAAPASRRIRLGALRDLVQGGQVDEAVAVAVVGDSILAAEGAIEAPGNGETEGSGADAAAGLSWLVETANLLVQTGKTDEAVAILRERQGAGLLGRDASLWLARLFIHRERLPEAIGLLREIVARWPEAERARLYLGEALAAQGDAAGGEAQLRRAVALAPADPECLIALVRVLALRAGKAGDGGPDSSGGAARSEELARLARQAAGIVRDDDARGRLILGYTFRALEDLEQAAQQFRAAAELAPVRREALLQLAVCEEDLGRFDPARQALETLLAEPPDDPTVENSLGYFLAQRGVELSRAEGLVRSALAKRPGNPYYLDSLGWVVFRRGEHAAAFDLLVEASNGAPDEPEILEHLGRALHALGRRAEAARAIERAIAAGGDRRRLVPLLREWTQEGGGQ